MQPGQRQMLPNNNFFIMELCKKKRKYSNAKGWIFKKSKREMRMRSQLHLMSWNLDFVGSFVRSLVRYSVFVNFEGLRETKSKLNLRGVPFL